MISRRQFIAGMGSLALSSTLYPKLSFAMTDGDQRLVVVILRGAMDGMAALVPYADPDYQATRGDLAMKPDTLLKIDSFFGLHPNLQPFAKMYEDGDMIAIPASATSYRERSHFDGQNVLEQGAEKPNALESGWLNRTLSSLQSSDDTALAFGQGIPEVFRGENSVGSWAPSGLPAVSEDYLNLIQRIYAQDTEFLEHLTQALQLESMGMPDNQQSGSAYQQFISLAETAGNWLSQEQGPRIATLELGGWDTHAQQGTENGRLANNFTLFANGIQALKENLGNAWDKTAVIAISEFGRTARPNGNMGTDHGTGGTTFLFGGALQGGRIVHDWPGLQSEQLYEDRDLTPTIDVRAVVKGILHEHHGISEIELAEVIYPDSHDIAPLTGLIKAT